MEKPAARARKVPKKITETYLHNSGLYYLQRFSTSTGNFRRVMLRKVDTSCRHHADQDREACVRLVDDLIVKFTRSGLLNDETYARAAVASLRRRGEFARTIEARLSAKGLAREQIRQFLEASEADDGITDFSAALRYARRRRLGPFRTPGKAEAGDRELSAMARGGYSYAIARRVLTLSAEEARDMIDGGAA